MNLNLYHYYGPEHNFHSYHFGKGKTCIGVLLQVFVVPVNALVSLQIRVQDLTAQVSSEIPDDSELSLLSKTKLEQDFKKYVTLTSTGLAVCIL